MPLPPLSLIPRRVIFLHLVSIFKTVCAFEMANLSIIRNAGVDLPDMEVRDSVSTDLPWNVVVHNDPVNLMSYVTKVFVKVFGFSEAKAKKHMLEVHQKGRSIVWSGARERAEFYVQQLHGYLLLSTIEKNS